MKSDILGRELRDAIGAGPQSGELTKLCKPCCIFMLASRRGIGHLLPFLVDFARFQTFQNGPNVVFFGKATCAYPEAVRHDG